MFVQNYWDGAEGRVWTCDDSVFSRALSQAELPRHNRYSFECILVFRRAFKSMQRTFIYVSENWRVSVWQQLRRCLNPSLLKWRPSHFSLDTKQSKMVHQHVTNQSAANKADKNYQVIMLVFLKSTIPTQLNSPQPPSLSALKGKVLWKETMYSQSKNNGPLV